MRRCSASSCLVRDATRHGPLPHVDRDAELLHPRACRRQFRLGLELCRPRRHADVDALFGLRHLFLRRRKRALRRVELEHEAFAHEIALADERRLQIVARRRRRQLDLLDVEPGFRERHFHRPQLPLGHLKALPIGHPGLEPALRVLEVRARELDPQPDERFLRAGSRDQHVPLLCVLQLA